MSRNTKPERSRSAAGKRGAYRPGAKPRRGNGLKVVRGFAVTLGWALALLAGLAATVYGYQKLDAPLAEVTVTGDFQRVTREHIEQWVSSRLDGGFFSLDMALLCAQLESHPWVAKVSARRQWPDRLLLHISEEIPVARWREAQFVNRRGDVLPAIAAEGNGAAEENNLPKLVGPEGQQLLVMRAYQRFARALNEAGAGLRELVLDKRGGWYLRLGEGEKLVLGRDHVDARLNRFLTLWQKELLARRSQVVGVDARYEKGLAVQWLPAKADSDAQEDSRRQKSNSNEQVRRAG